MSRPQFAYILPEYDPGTATHFAHLYDLLQAVCRDVDVHLVIERGSAPEGPFASTTVLRHSGFARLIEEYSVFKKLRIGGCARFYTHYSFTGAIAAGLVCRSSNATSFYWNCGMPWLFTPRFGQARLLDWIKNRLPLLLAMRLCTYVVTGTAGLARMYSREYGVASSKFKVLPNWISLERFFAVPSDVRATHGIATDAPLITFVHRLSPRKGADLLVPIMAALKDRAAVLLVVGGGPYQRLLKQQITAAGLDSRIKILGSVPNTDVPGILAASDVLLMPSREEGFPRVLLEAMALGVPFVAADVGGVSEIVPSGTMLVAPEDVNSFATELDALLADSALRRSRADAGREHVRQYDLPEMARKFIELVKQ